MQQPDVTNTLENEPAPFEAAGEIHEKSNDNNDKVTITKDPRFINARQLFLDGDLDASETIFAVLDSETRNDPYIMCYMGIFAARREDYAMATSKLLAASKLSDDPLILINLGLCLNEQDRHDSAITCFNKVLKQDPDNIAAYTNMVGTLFARGDLETCGRMIEHGLKRFPDNKILINRQMNLYLLNGEMEKGLELTTTLLNERPLDTELLRLRLEFGKLERDHIAITLAQKTVASALKAKKAHERAWGISPAFSLFRFFEQHKEYDTAFDYLEKANILKRETINYSQEQVDHVFGLKIKSYPEDTITSDDEHKATEQYPYTPIFIVGMPRSGTTLTEQILASHPDAFGAGELKELGYIFRKLYAGDPRNMELDDLYFRDLTDQQILQLGGAYSRTMYEKAGHNNFKYTTDKMPQNFMNLAAIRRVFPHAKIIHTMRNPVDNCLSIYSKNFSGHHDYGYSQKTLGEYYCKYVEIMEHWNSIMPGKIYNQQYEELVSDFEPNVRKLLDFCEIPFHEDCLKPHETKRSIRTASASQVVKPIYQSSVEKWRRYESHLGELLEALKPVYTPTPLADSA